MQENYEKQYHENVHDSLVFNNRYYNCRAKLARLKYFKNLPDDIKILEFGCGLGQDIYLFPNSVGYDISAYSLDFCRAKGITTIRSMDGAEDHAFDVVYSAHTLEHIINPYETLTALKSKINKNGKLILILPTEKHGKASFEMDTNQHLFCWNFRTINNLLIKCGFEVLENKYFRGIGYDKFLFTSSFGIHFYRRVTQFIAFVFGIKELYIIAQPK
nr:class I SAM-dependent methyltransferase [Bacteroidota bacterium]